MKDKKTLVKIIKAQGNITHYSHNSIISLIRKQKNFDLLVSIVVFHQSIEKEIPILLVEFSTAVKTDDHEWQRFDGIYWANYYRVPYLKISSLERESPTAQDNFGGGSSLSIEDETYVLHQNRGVMYHINWNKIESSEYLETHPEYHSCPPYSIELERILFEMCNLIINLSNPNNFFPRLYGLSGAITMPVNFQNLFPPPNSTRLRWNDREREFIIKINRFGHGMDPEKGGAAFFNMLMNSLNYDCPLIVEFNIERNRIIGRESYNSLFDALSKFNDLMEIARDVFENHGNSINFNLALNIFQTATTTHELFSHHTIRGNSVIISDGSLRTFLEESRNSTIKNLLFYSDKIMLTNINREEIISIEWNNHLIEAYYGNLRETVWERITPLPIRRCHNRDIKEDLITYICMQILRNAGLRILAVSYPSAQGERCVLIGEGRNVRRKFIDLIAINERDHNFDIILQENKDDLNKTSVRADIQKMENINENYLANLIVLINNLTTLEGEVAAVYIGLGGKIINHVRHTTIDYIMLIDFSYISNENIIPWSVGIINLELSNIFQDLINNNRIEGVFEMPTDLYIINR